MHTGWVAFSDRSHLLTAYNRTIVSTMRLEGQDYTGVIGRHGRPVTELRQLFNLLFFLPATLLVVPRARDTVM